MTIYTILGAAVIIIYLMIAAFIIYLAYLIIKALRKYVNSKDVREEKVIVRQSLAEILKEHRTHCKMTQEFVAEAIGVSRQAVSKWENGSADPSTTNLIALSNLYGIPAEELLKNVTRKNEQNHFSEEEMKNKK